MTVLLEGIYAVLVGFMIVGGALALMTLVIMVIDLFRGEGEHENY